MTLFFSKPDGTPITTWQEWTRPKRDYQWKEGRSAMELARSWFKNGVAAPPDELCALLGSHPRLEGIEFIRGTPELVTPLPERGEGRNHDLHLIGKTASEQVTICIEAKADEPFGNETVIEYWNRSMLRRGKGISTRVPERIIALLPMLEPDTHFEESAWKNIKYQLVTALCGTALQMTADRSDVAILIIHEFHSDQTLKEKHHQNQNDLDRCLSILSEKEMECRTGILYGPFFVGDANLFIGKITTLL